ncbi:MAG: CvpA family protein [Roseiflexaceae bacterium]|jgi:membrane protein required for colicin V production
MTLVDLAIVFIMTMFAVLGFYWGAIRQLIAITGLIASLVIAGRVGIQFAELIQVYVVDNSIAMALSVMMIMLAVNGGASILASLIQQHYGLIALGTLDHIIGGILGFVQAVITLVGLLLILAAFPNQLWIDSLRASTAVNLIVYLFGGMVLPVIPEPLQSAVRMVIFR